jgi:hypothetical protein
VAQGHPIDAALDGVVPGQRSVEIVRRVGRLALAGVVQLVADPAQERVDNPRGELLHRDQRLGRAADNEVADGVDGACTIASATTRAG